MARVGSPAQSPAKERSLAEVLESEARLCEQVQVLELRMAKAEERRRALIHIMRDLDQLNKRLADQRKAMLHILVDYERDRSRLAQQTECLDNSRRALLHILQDSHHSNQRLEKSRKAMIHIMDDLRKTTEAMQLREHELRDKQRMVEERTYELREANRIKDEFLATLSHELRTPLNAILGWVQLLREGALDEEAATDAIHRVERNTKSLVKLIDDLLDVSRIITGKFKLEVRPIDLGPVIEAAIEAVRPAIEAKGIQLGLALEPLGLVSGDPSRLQQVVWNLLSNAIKFTSPGGRVEVRLEQVGANGLITVSDTGEGIPETFLPYVFDRFRQANGVFTKEHGGLGLGLAIVRHLVEMHGGAVRADSPGRGKGATFTVTLPCIRSHPNLE